MIDTSPERQTNVTCETKQGRALQFILGQTKEVLKYDKARKRIKASPNNDNYLQDYLDNLALMETRVSREQRITKERLKIWERQHFDQYCKLPTSQDMLSDPAAKLLMDKLKYCKAIGRSGNPFRTHLSCCKALVNRFC